MRSGAQARAFDMLTPGMVAIHDCVREYNKTVTASMVGSCP